MKVLKLVGLRNAKIKMLFNLYTNYKNTTALLFIFVCLFFVKNRTKNFLFCLKRFLF